MKPLAIIDVDGVISDFKNIDHEIIYNMYKGNVLVMLLDKLLWFINGLDLITNNFGIFRLRIRIYSLLNCSNYSVDMKRYKEEYIQKSNKHFNQFIDEQYNMLKQNGFDIVILSCDIFASSLNGTVKAVHNKRDYVKRFIYKNYSEIFVIGNNYMDDVLSGMKLRRKCVVHVNIIYVGKSKLLKFLSKINNFLVCNTLKDAIKFVIKK